MAARCIIDAGPFIHLNQIGEIALLKKFPSIHTPASVLAEISFGKEVPVQKIRRWKNFKVQPVKEKTVPEIERIGKEFGLHAGEKDVLYLARRLSPCIVLTDDLPARNACENLMIEVHGTVGIIAYAFHKRWISFKRSEKALIMLSRKSSLFITTAIIEGAIEEMRRSSS